MTSSHSPSVMTIMTIQCNSKMCYVGIYKGTHTSTMVQITKKQREPWETFIYVSNWNVFFNQFGVFSICMVCVFFSMFSDS